ncbi:MAG TPA: hypothetical protein VF787_03225 [Thermoanaerobaculia bacterium]
MRFALRAVALTAVIAAAVATPARAAPAVPTMPIVRSDTAQMAPAVQHAPTVVIANLSITVEQVAAIDTAAAPTVMRQTAPATPMTKRFVRLDGLSRPPNPDASSADNGYATPFRV